MKKRIFGVIIVMLVMCISLSSCALMNTIKDLFNTVVNPPVEISADPLNADMLINFEEGANPDVLFESDGWSNGDVFNVVWKKHNVIYENGIMRLGITEEKVSAWLNDEEVEFDYSAGEARTQNYYHYGDFEVSMKPSANPGTASTFFTCTGPYDTKFVLDEDGNYLLDDNGQRVTVENPHDEIDIEFLGTDTTHVQFNFFVDGVGGNEYMHNLGFDASEDFHTYGYRWEPDSITWFVDGEPVYMVTTDTSVQEAGNVKIVEKLPSTPGRILTNYWCGNERAVGWMGLYTGAIKDNGTEYQWIKTSAAGAPLNPEEAPDVEDAEINWAEIDPISPDFPSAEKYVVTVDGNKANVTYTDVGGSDYKPIEMDITEASADKNYVYLKVTNNGSETVQVRVNVVDMALVEAGAQNMATNISATMNGVAVNTDLVWGGSFFDIPAGETCELVVKFQGEVEKLQLMIDSSRNDTALRSGDITVEDVKFAKLGDVVIPDDPTPNPPAGDGDDPVEDSGIQLEFWASDASLYTISGHNIKYNGAGNTYACVGSDVTALAAGNNTFTVTITNNGATSAKVRVDLQATVQVGNHKVVNTGATGGDVWTDSEWGGSAVNVAAGESVTLVITYDETTERGAVKDLIFFVDAMKGDAETYSSDITVSGMAFSKVGGDEPIDPPAVETPAGEYLSFTGNECYTLSATASDYVDSINVTYTEVSDNTYQNVNTWIQDKAAGKSSAHVTIKNNGTETVNITVKLENGTGGATETKVVLAAGESFDATLAYTFAPDLLYFFIDSGWAEATATHAGDVTISNIYFQ